MAKKQPRSRAVTSSGPWIVCAGYTLSIRNDDAHFVFELDAKGADAKEYILRVKVLNDRPGLVQKALRVLADRWPAYAWEFQAGDDGSIADIR